MPEPMSGCHLWLAYLDKDGYGRFEVERKKWMAHRFSWTLNCGEIPKGMHVLHHCDNPTCINPNHLYVGTRKQNMQDCLARKRNHCANKTHCPKGHPYSEENTYKYKSNRICKTCTLIHGKKAYKDKGYRERKLAYQKERYLRKKAVQSSVLTIMD